MFSQLQGSTVTLRIQAGYHSKVQSAHKPKYKYMAMVIRKRLRNGITASGKLSIAMWLVELTLHGSELLYVT